jgi:dGTPase
MKYPWLRHSSGDRHDKWGAYPNEQRFLKWARKDHPDSDYDRSVEAELMDWADDVAYAVHDVEDFYRAGLIPLDRLINNNTEQGTFLEGTIERLSRKRSVNPAEEEQLSNAFAEIKLYIRAIDPYRGTRRQRAALRNSTSFFIDRYINAMELSGGRKSDGPVSIDPELKREVTILKQLTWHYVIENPALETQQYGIRRVIETLFEAFSDAASSRRKWTMFPEGYREELQKIEDRVMEGDKEKERIRTVVDLIASMTEQQALKMHQRLIGVSLGSVLDPTAL